MSRLIDADALKEYMGCADAVKYGNKTAEQLHNSYSTIMMYEVADYIDDMPTIEAEPVVRCKDCVYFRDRHILLKDGTERDYAEGEGCVTADVGVNCGSQCRKEEEPCFREPGDFCSRGVRKDGGHE